MGAIHFFSEEIEFQLPEPSRIEDWIKNVIQAESKSLNSLNFIFCSDEHLHKINSEYLKKDYYTDVITFDYSEKEKEIEGEVFISIPRIHDNASSLGHDYQTELHRVIIHGVLHLLGYDDTTDIDQAAMRKKEEACLSLLDQQ